MRFITIFSLILLLLSSCGTTVVSKKVQDAATTVASVFQAKSCTLGYTESASTDQGIHSTVVLTVTDPNALDSAYDHDMAASTAAILFMENLSKEDYLGMDRLKIEIKNKISYERTYDIKRLETTLDLMRMVLAFDRSFQNKDLKGMSKDADHALVPDSSMQILLAGKNKIDSAFGERKSYTITGFTYRYSEPDKEYLVQFTAQSIYSSAAVDFHYELSEKRKKFTSIHFKGNMIQRESADNK